MNAQFQVAQLSGSPTSGSNAAPTRIFRLSKPLGDQAVVVNLGYDQKAKVDFSGIANEKITLVHVGDKLIILFDNKSTVTVEPFFDSRHDALGNLSVEVAPGREVSVNEFASLFPITTDQSVLPAAGEGGGNAQASGANFSNSVVDPLVSRNPLDLLGQEELGNFRLTPETFAGVPDAPNAGPSASFTISGALLIHDETLGVQVTANDQANPLLPAVFQQAGLIGWAESAAPIIASATIDFGTNGPGTVAYVLTTAAGGAFNGVDSGLQATATGNHIFLFTEGNLVVAREGNGATPNSGGAIAFELYLDPATLKLSVAQYEAIQHNNALDANDRTELADVVFVQQVVTDGQGIVVTEVSSSPVGVAFDDDGPAIQVTVAESDGEGPSGLETLVLDESTGNDPQGVFPHGTVDDTGFTAPDPTGTNPIGRLETSAGGEEQGQGALQALFNVVKDPGTDGEKSTTYQYSFALTGGSGPSGIVATTLEVTDPNDLYADDTIYLFKVSDTEIVGHVGNDPNGPIAIRITLVNADSLSGGQLVVEQYMAIDHGQDGNNFDSSKWLTLLGGGEQGAASLGVTLTATITDVDNDTATSSATIQIAGSGEASSIVFQDDGPVLVSEAVVIATVDEDGLPGHNADAGRPGEVAGTGSAVATGSLASLVDFGTDGPGANAFHLVTQIAPVDTGLTSQGGHVLIVSDGTTLHGYVESGNGSGFTAGDREIFTLTVGPDGSYTFTLKDQVDHPSQNNVSGDDSENSLAATLDLSSFIVATDGDGDFVNLAPGTFEVDVQDDIPVLTGGTVSIVVDEDDINTAWSHGTSPSDGSSDGSLTEGSTGAAIVTGSLAGLVATGADEPGTFAFSADAIAQLTALGLFSKQTAQGDGENGKPLFYQTSSGGPNEIVITGYEPNPHGNPVLSLTLNTVTGAYEFRLFDELIHVADDGQNTDLRSGLPVDGIQASVPNIDFGSIITFTDRDGDQVTLNGKFTVTITDDVPHADIDIGRGSVTIDETPGNQADDTTSSSVRNLFANLEATFVDGVRLVGDDPDVSGDNNGGNSGNGAIAYAHSDFAVVVNDSVIGSDSPPYPHQFTLSVTNGNGTASGLFVTDGSPINLSMRDGLVIGTVVGGQFDGKVAFAIAIGADGEVSVAQYLSIRHDDRGDSNESNDNGSNYNDASPDDPVTIQQTLNGKIIATLTVTDSDGDQSSNSVNIGNLITFLDDGPSVDVKVVHDAHLIHDETPGIDAADDDVAGTSAFAGSTLAAVFSAVDTPRGDDPHVTDNPIGYALTNGTVFSLTTQNYGADGAAAVKPIQYELVLSSNNVHSGLQTTDGRDIHLFKEGNLIVGRYEVGGNNIPDGSSDEVAAFAISIDPATGQLAMVQYVSLHHPNEGNPDDTVQLNDGTLSVKVTLTDGDGDPASDIVDISCVIQFEDDGPTLVGSATLSIAVDEDGLATGNADAGRIGETAGTGSAVASGAAGALNALVNFGADGPGSAAFSLAIQSFPVNTGLESKGGDVFIVSDGTTLRGYVNLGGNSGYQPGTDREVFTLTVGSNGSYTFTLKDQIDHPSLNGTTGDNAENLLSGSIDLSKYIVATDGDGDSVKLGNGTFVVQIRDDIPTTASNTLVTVDEDDLAAGNHDAAAGDDVTAVSPVTGTLQFSVGADETATVGFASLHSTAVVDAAGHPVTAGGQPLSYVWDLLTNTLYATPDGNPAHAAFKVGVNPSTGAYSFSLLGQVDHPGHDADGLNNGPETAYEDNINIDLTYTVTDRDGDSATGTLTVSIDDDMPVLDTGATNNLVLNGSFEQGHGLADNQWSIYHSLQGGWTTSDLGPAGPNGDVPFEVQTGNIGGTFAQDGNALVELDSDFGSGNLAGGDHFNDSGHTNTILQQVVAGTQAGQAYELTFWYAPRIGAGDADSGGMNVLWNGNVVKSINSSDMTPGVWQQIVVTVDGTGPNNVLAFQATGQENSFGAFIDNVSLVPAITVDEDGLTGPWSFGNHDSQPGDNIVADSDADGNEATATGNLNIKWGADNLDGGVDGVTSAATLKSFIQDHPDGIGDRSVTFTNATVAVSGVAALLSHGDAVTFTLNADGTVLTGSAGAGATLRDVIRISLSDDGTGQFRVVLLDQIDHAPGGNENDIGLRFNYTATDSDGDAVEGTFVVNVDDDMPVAVDDTIATPITGAFTTGNLLANDAFGADDPVASGLLTFTNGAHGTVVYNNDGTFTYVPAAGYDGSDSFTYTIRDGDGDTSTATVTLSNIHSNTLPAAGSTSASVDDEGLPNGIAGSTFGDDLPGQAITASGTLPHDYNTDGKAASDPINFAPMHGTSGLVGAETVTYNWDAGSNTLTATSAARGAIFTVEVDGGSDNGNGDYVFTLLKPVIHAAGNNENDATVNLTYQVKDATLPSADTATGTLAITLDDDIPVAAPIVKTVTETSSDTNILLILDRSGSMDFASGVAGYATRLDLLKAAANELLDQYDAAGDVRVQIIKFNDSAQKQGSTWLSVADAKTYINGLSANDGTDYDDAAALAPDAFDDPGKLSTPGVRNVSYFLSDGQPEPTDEQVSGSELTSWINFVNANDIVSYAIGLGSSATDTYLDPLAYDGTGSGTDTDALIVTNLDQLQPTLVGTVSPSISGSVIDGSIPTSFGADGGYVKSIAIGGKTYSYNPTTDQVTESSSGGQSAYSFNTATNKLTITFSGSVGESFVIDLDDGSYVYTPPTNIVADFNRPFTYTLTDNDGDTASSTLTINVNNVNEVAAVNDIIRTNFDGTAFDVPEWALLFNDTTESGTLDITGVSNESSLDVTNPAGNVVNIDDDGSTANGGSFDYTASNGTSTGTGSVQVFNKNGGGNVTGTSANEILVGDGDGDTFDGGSGVDIILAGGGSDTIVADQNDHVLDGGSGTDTLRVGSNFTSSSNAHIANIENVTLTAAVTLNLANQTEAFTITGSSGADVITGGAGADTITGGAGGDRMTGGSGAGVVDTFVIGSGQTTLSIGGSGNNGTISGYDTITDFNLAVDKLSLNGTPFAASNTSGTNGSNSSLTIGGNQISSHAITNGIIRFDDSGTFSTALTLDSTQDVAAVVDYLRHNDLGSAGATVAFTATIGGVNHTYIYQQVGNGPSTTNDILVDLENVTLTSGGTSLATLIGNGHVDPIVLDLGDQGISFSSIGEGVQFDINADGASDQVAWTVNGQDGILALDVDGSGKIEGGKELFTPNFNGGQFADGIAALASLDGNHDGVIDGQDQAFGELVVWQDANHNGVSETDELAKLGDLGITGISLNATPGGAPIDGQNIAGTGSFTYADGSTGTFVEVDLDASLGTASAQPDSNPAEDHDLTVFTAVAAEIDYGGGDIDLSGLLQSGADHAPAPQTQGAEAAHAGVDAGATTPAAITIMHEQAALAMQLAAS